MTLNLKNHEYPTVIFTFSVFFFFKQNIQQLPVYLPGSRITRLTRVLEVELENLKKYKKKKKTPHQKEKKKKNAVFKAKKQNKEGIGSEACSEG